MKNPFAHTTSDDVVLDRLGKVGQFAFGGVGFASTLSQGEQDYVQISARPTAADDFEKLFHSGDMEAKCYSLAGLFHLNHDKFLQLALPLRKGDAKVSVMTGCVMNHQAVATVIGEIEAGAYPTKK